MSLEARVAALESRLATLNGIRRASPGVSGLLSGDDKPKLDQFGLATAWTAVTYDPDWVDAGGVFQVVQYHKRADGVVEVRGVAKRLVGITTQDPIFTLPAGFRPAAEEYFAAYGSDGTTIGPSLINVTSAGVVSFVRGYNSAWLTLSGMYFQAV